ncbi:MAG TPA: hypothetical protein VMI32_04115 [Candidatus Solibacter sp.]|nr:hypothetical protein [Candidatus Solibacter sp.]
MPCENYREALIETAAMNLAPSRELRAHLDSCTSCRAASKQEMQLFAAIDTGVQAKANADVPASLLPRVRAKLSENPVSRRPWSPAFAAIAAAAVVVISLVAILGSRRTTLVVNPRTKAAGHAPSSSEISTYRSGTVSQTTSSKRMPRRKLTRSAEASVSVEQVTVLIPAGQKQAVDNWLIGLRRGRVSTTSLFAEKPELSSQELKISPLDLPLIEVKPLAEVGGRPALENEKTSR